MNATAKTPTSRETQGQLSSILDYYNNPVKSAALKDIDWEGHKSRIHTPGVVDAIKAKYDGFMASEYQVDAAVSMIGNDTAKMQALDVAMKYNYQLYLTHYMGHLDQMELMRNIGDINKLSIMEMMKLTPGIETAQAAHQETGNLAPDSHTEEMVMTRICTQFSWGSKVQHPFVHSQDTISSVVATLGKLGK